MNSEKNNQFDDADIEWLKGYAATVESTFGSLFERNAERFETYHQPVNRFASCVQTVIDKGIAHFSAIDEAHNELCIAAALLKNENPDFSSIIYEPPLADCPKTIDFKAIASDGRTVYIDVKTIKPDAVDRWDQFLKIKEKSLLPENVSVILQKEWLGGEIWHNMFTARSRMLEYTLEFESKIASAKLTDKNIVNILVFCGAGFHWHEDELEDFVEFYKTGRHRADDAFSKMEEHYLKKNTLPLQRLIHQFACLKRYQSETFKGV